MTSARILVVTGTDTGAGKTVLTAGLAAALRKEGVRAEAVKPVATGVAAGAPGEDAELLGRATGRARGAAEMERLRLPRSPLAAAAAEGRELDVDALVGAVRERADDGGADLLLVEGVGGLLVPLTPTATVATLVRRLGAPVVVAARAGLGTINHTALTVLAARHHGLDVLGVVLVDTDGGTEQSFAVENAVQIGWQCDVPVLGVLRHLEAPDDPDVLARAVAADVDLGPLRSWLTGDRDAAPAAVVAADRAHVWHPFTQTSEWLAEDPVVVVRGEGCELVAADGARYLDGVASLWANVHGHAHPALDRALHEQAGRVSHSTFLGLTHEPGARLAAELAAVAPPGLTRVFFSEAGAAAVEVALRVALLAQARRGAPGRTRFLSLADAYHGDTAGAVSVGRSEPFHRGLGPLLVDAVRVPSPHAFVRTGMADAEAEAASLAVLTALLRVHGHRLAAFVVEPRVQGAAGVWTHSDAWLRSAVEACRRSGLLVVCDEIATGFGRTGDLFASGGAAVTPDILTVGKGLTGGYLPLSATLTGETIFDLFTGPYDEHRTLYYGHTYSANPVACAVARASLRLFDDESTLARARRLADHLGRRLDELRALPAVADVRRCGVMAGVELCAGGLALPFDHALRVGRQVVLAARRRGVILRPLGDVVVVNPPLVMSDAQADRLVDALAESIAEVTTALVDRPSGVPSA